jgi:hypothetical protein
MYTSHPVSAPLNGMGGDLVDGSGTINPAALNSAGMVLLFDDFFFLPGRSWLCDGETCVFPIRGLLSGNDHRESGLFIFPMVFFVRSRELLMLMDVGAASSASSTPRRDPEHQFTRCQA